ncbi:hypothetical protein COCON_G00226810 [Conger conger]|uniref:Ras association domain-containing protein 4 n=1 Tax=Conger conger TaxID=82655 RepID=A0A9Q1HNU0_CONCO|nr:hypothetical protein COCON_G00226810 [Conger conger]
MWEEGELIMDGLLNISWGLKRPIRLQMQDDYERIRFSVLGPWRTENTQNVLQKQASVESNNNFYEPTSPPTQAYSDISSSEEEMPQLMRTQSDASVISVPRRSKLRGSIDLQRLRRHRFSINGHFYNHKTSVFTPAYGSVTNVRVNSTMTTLQVLNLLLNKFRVENESDEFALYVVHESGERTRLKDSEYPLITRLLHGPCEKIAKIFLMETDLGEEVTYDVAQYIKFEMPVLDSFVQKLQEEEEREVSKLTRKYITLKLRILQQLDVSESPDTV